MGDDKETARHFAARNRAEKAGQGALDLGGGGHGRLPPPPPLADASRALRALPEDSVEEIAEKQRRVRAAEADPRRWRWRVAADLYVAAFLTPTTGGVPDNRNTVTIPTTGHVWAELSGQQVFGPLIGRAQDLAGEARAFHWPLEFPEAFATGGFDVVLGNPPWDRIKLQEKEFFSSRRPEIARAKNKAARQRLISKLRESPPGSYDRCLFDEFERSKRLSEALSIFARTPKAHGGRFPLTGRGDVNTYSLFAELFARLTARNARAGVIVPTGIATDATTAPFFSALMIGRRLFSLHDFQTGLGFFDRIGHARFKFCLMTLGESNSGPERPAFSFFSRTANEFADRRCHFTLSRDDIARISPNTMTAPIFRTQADADLASAIHQRAPVLIYEANGTGGNPWGASFATMFHMANDSGLFRTAPQLRAAGFEREGVNWISRGLALRQQSFEFAGGRAASELDLQGGSNRLGERHIPLVEAKSIHQFDHRWATAREDLNVPLSALPTDDDVDSDENGDEETDAKWCRDSTSFEKSELTFEPTPRYWVCESDLVERLDEMRWRRNWLMAWRDICRSTDERTVIATVCPRAGVVHTAPLFFVDAQPQLAAALLCNLNALALDYVARLKVGGTHLTYGYLKQFPVLPPSSYAAADLAFVTNRVLELDLHQLFPRLVRARPPLRRPPFRLERRPSRAPARRTRRLLRARLRPHARRAALHPRPRRPPRPRLPVRNLPRPEDQRNRTFR
jgi:hypothetical protein